MSKKRETGPGEIQFTLDGLIRPLFDLLSHRIREKIRGKKKQNKY